MAVKPEKKLAREQNHIQTPDYNIPQGITVYVSDGTKNVPHFHCSENNAFIMTTVEYIFPLYVSALASALAKSGLTIPLWQICLFPGQHRLFIKICLAWIFHGKQTKIHEKGSYMSWTEISNPNPFHKQRENFYNIWLLL